jgi:hypothetical protein
MQGRGKDMAGILDCMRCRQNDLGVGRRRDYFSLIRIIQLGQKMPHAVQPCAFLIVRPENRPREIGRVGIEKHRLCAARPLMAPSHLHQEK